MGSRGHKEGEATKERLQRKRRAKEGRVAGHQVSHLELEWLPLLNILLQPLLISEHRLLFVLVEHIYLHIMLCFLSSLILLFFPYKWLVLFLEFGLDV